MRRGNLVITLRTPANCSGHLVIRKCLMRWSSTYGSQVVECIKQSAHPLPTASSALEKYVHGEKYECINEVVVRHEAVVRHKVVVKLEAVVRHQVVVRHKEVGKHEAVVRHEAVDRHEAVVRHETVVRHEALVRHEAVVRLQRALI
ncbi:hypothetical protein Btru_041743 [Bulinus truncatus]|nr:hypothetical protein Btru_041743 [Bulinus truncatus]